MPPTSYYTIITADSHQSWLLRCSYQSVQLCLPVWDLKCIEVVFGCFQRWWAECGGKEEWQKGIWGPNSGACALVLIPAITPATGESRRCFQEVPRGTRGEGHGFYGHRASFQCWLKAANLTASSSKEQDDLKLYNSPRWEQEKKGSQCFWRLMLLDLVMCSRTPTRH